MEVVGIYTIDSDSYKCPCNPFLINEIKVTGDGQSIQLIGHNQSEHVTT